MNHAVMNNAVMNEYSQDNFRMSGHRTFRSSAAIAAFCLLFLFASQSLAEDTAQHDRIEDISFKASCDGSEQKYVIVHPDLGDTPQQTFSVLVVLHGHGSDRWQFVRESRGECRAARDVAREHAMLLVSPDYRAKTSWMGPKATADMVQIIQSLKTRFPVDRVIVCGGSMGGTGALTFTALHPELVDGVVSLNGTANLVEYTQFTKAFIDSYGGSKTEVSDEYRKRSAEFFPERFDMPLATTTGGRDEMVPAESLLRLVAAVQKQNQHVLSIHRPKGGHNTNYADTKTALEFVISATTERPNIGRGQ